MSDPIIELPIQTRQAIFQAGRAAGIMAFMEQILHGSEEHRTWLRKAAENFIVGVPIMTEQEIRDNRCLDCRWIYGEHSPDCRHYKPKDFRDAATHSP